MSEAPVTFVNVLAVDPERQQELVDLLREGAESVIRRRPGFVALRLLAAVDGSQVISIADWSGADAAKATMDDPDAAAYARRAAEIATPAPALHRVVSEHAA